ncbi:SDR family oxidoreductase [Alkalicoccus chagannorensis]|uniref:SDR family oxidoreductase n=1 Tax=Alkalicoccus chagannorensis TaxID=427072 RepID=UPI0003F7F279|nr:SDR family oxidoreductase [Alkalicoccus chagannorensis]
MEELKDIAGSTAVVTGASSGIGAGIARRLAAQDVNVVLAARRIEKLEELEQELQETGSGGVLTVRTDVTNQVEMTMLADKAAETFGQVDIYVNNAGQMLAAPVLSGEVDAWDQMIDVNIKGVLYGVHSVVPGMIERGSGHIINIASVSGWEVTKMSTVYSATKFAVRALSTGLEKELAKTGVRVTNISPGMVDSIEDGESAWHGDRRKLETNDIARAVVYAVTQPDYVNVNEITVRPV